MLSGSESLFLKKHAKESLAGRIFVFNVDRLSFREFIEFKGGLLNGVYASIVYGVIIFVAQLMLRYTTSYALTNSFLLK